VKPAKHLKTRPKPQTGKTCILPAFRSLSSCVSPLPTRPLKSDFPEGGVCVLNSKRSTALIPLDIEWSTTQRTLKIRVGRQP
jgi:hypothetical protein